MPYRRWNISLTLIEINRGVILSTRTVSCGKPVSTCTTQTLDAHAGAFMLRNSCPRIHPNSAYKVVVTESTRSPNAHDLVAKTRKASTTPSSLQSRSWDFKQNELWLTHIALVTQYLFHMIEDRTYIQPIIRTKNKQTEPSQRCRPDNVLDTLLTNPICTQDTDIARPCQSRTLTMPSPSTPSQKMSTTCLSRTPPPALKASLNENAAVPGRVMLDPNVFIAPTNQVSRAVSKSGKPPHVYQTSILCIHILVFLVRYSFDTANIHFRRQTINMGLRAR